MVVSFQLHAVGDSGLFQQVGLDIGTGDAKDVGKVNTNEFAETGRVVVTGGLGVTIGLQDGIGRDDLVFQTWFVWVFNLAFLLANASGYEGKVLDDFLGVFSFTSARLTTIYKCIPMLLFLWIKREGSEKQCVTLTQIFKESLTELFFNKTKKL